MLVQSVPPVSPLHPAAMTVDAVPFDDVGDGAGSHDAAGAVAGACTLLGLTSSRAVSNGSVRGGGGDPGAAGARDETGLASGAVEAWPIGDGAEEGALLGASTAAAEPAVGVFGRGGGSAVNVIQGPAIGVAIAARMPGCTADGGAPALAGARISIAREEEPAEVPELSRGEATAWGCCRGDTNACGETSRAALESEWTAAVAAASGGPEEPAALEARDVAAEKQALSCEGAVGMSVGGTTAGGNTSGGNGDEVSS